MYTRVPVCIKLFLPMARNLHDNVLEVGLVAIVSEWDVPDVFYWMSPVIACLDISGSLGCV